MALYNDIRSKIARQELELDIDSRNFKQYSAKVKYLPENVEKPDFFSLCCGVLKPGDTDVIRTKVDKTNKEESYDVLYNFLVLQANPDEQKVEVLQLKKVDMLNPLEEVKGVDMEALNKVIIAIVEANIDKFAKDILELKNKFDTYTTETDDQLEEIENNIEDLQNTLGAAENEEGEDEGEAASVNNEQ